MWNGGDGFSGATGRGITVAVIDTGVDLDHPEFSGRIVDGYDFVDGDTTADDGNGHGTHVAGTIAGANDGIGITGVAYDAEIMPLRVLNDDGYGWTSDIISAVRWAADNDADVINLSLGGEGYSLAMADDQLRLKPRKRRCDGSWQLRRAHRTTSRPCHQSRTRGSCGSQPRTGWIFQSSRGH